MLDSYMRLFFTYIASLMLLPSFAMAQWTNVAPNLLAPFRPGYGAIHYADGVVWAGNSSLWSSADSGKTWTKSAYPGGAQIRDIHFLDRNIGLVASEETGVYLTRDGGQTWKQIIDGEAWEVSFNGSTNIIHALMTAPGILFTSLDGGTTWSWKNVGTYGMGFAIDRNNRILVFTGERYLTSSRGFVIASADYGATWSNPGAVVDGDSYTISVDSCDERKLYLVNEDYASSIDGVSQLYSSTDAGLTWIPGIADSGLFLNGSLATTRNTLYMGTVLNSGVLRSTNRGATWMVNGGPAIGYDSRNIVAVNDNIVFAIGVNGSVWATFNSGGDSLVIDSGTDTIAFATTKHEPKSTIRALDTVQVNIVVRFPSGSGVTSIVPNDATYRLRFNKEAIGILQTDLSKNVLPPPGWTFKSGTVGDGFVSITLKNAGGSMLQFEQNFGKIVFTALANPAQQSTVVLDQLFIDAKCDSYISFFGVELGVIKSISVLERDVDATRSEPVAITVFPNPATHSITMQSLTDIGTIEIEVFDELGRKHLDDQRYLLASESASIDVSSLISGVYYLRIEGLGFKATKRIVINK